MSKQLTISRAPAKADKPLSPSEFLDTLPGMAETPAKAKEQAAEKPPKPSAARRPDKAPAPLLPPVAGKEAIQRLTLDIPFSLHHAIKVACVQRGTTMKDEVMALLERHYRQS